jgi:LacI family transcriptional regulator
MAKDSGIPLVFFDRTKESLGIHSVVIDDFKGAYLATKHLLDQGYQKVAHIAGPQHLKIFEDRLRGYQAAIAESKQIPDDALIYSGNVSIEAGKSAIAHFLKLPDPPDAVFAVEDFTALGAIKELKAQKINIPLDFGIVGFANEAFGEHITPTLSTIDQQTVKMGNNSFELLMQLMNDSTSVITEQKRILEPLPVWRESSNRNK